MLIEMKQVKAPPRYHVLTQFIVTIAGERVSSFELASAHRFVQLTFTPS